MFRILLSLSVLYKLSYYINYLFILTFQCNIFFSLSHLGALVSILFVLHFFLTVEDVSQYQHNTLFASVVMTCWTWVRPLMRLLSHSLFQFTKKEIVHLTRFCCWRFATWWHFSHFSLWISQGILDCHWHKHWHDKQEQNIQEMAEAWIYDQSSFFNEYFQEQPGKQPK